MEGISLNMYKTAQIAKMIGVHPNTIRFYEEMKLLPQIPRSKSGYRIFNDHHLDQLRLLRTGFRAEIISSRLRHEVCEIVKTAALQEFEVAYQSTLCYLRHLQEERARAEEAIRITIGIIENTKEDDNQLIYRGRQKVANVLGITIDVLRDWERNGLIFVPRSQNRQGIYRLKEMNRLKIIRILRNAHYSMMSILRMLNHLDQGERNIRELIDTPDAEEDIVCATDRYISALSMAEKDAKEMLWMLDVMRKRSYET